MFKQSDPDSSYAEGPEIHAYFKKCAIKWNCMKYIKFNHKVISAKWSESGSHWDLDVEVGDDGTIIHDQCDVLLSATGVLKYKNNFYSTYILILLHSKWVWPSIKGLHDFKGILLHPARWDYSHDLTDKVIAVIGAGSSAIQIVPQLTPSITPFTRHGFDI